VLRLEAPKLMKLREGLSAICVPILSSAVMLASLSSCSSPLRRGVSSVVEGAGNRERNCKFSRDAALMLSSEEC